MRIRRQMAPAIPGTANGPEYRGNPPRKPPPPARAVLLSPLRIVPCSGRFPVAQYSNGANKSNGSYPRTSAHVVDPDSVRSARRGCALSCRLARCSFRTRAPQWKRRAEVSVARLGRDNRARRAAPARLPFADLPSPRFTGHRHSRRKGSDMNFRDGHSNAVFGIGSWGVPPKRAQQAYLKQILAGCAALISPWYRQSAGFAGSRGTSLNETKDLTAKAQRRRDEKDEPMRRSKKQRSLSMGFCSRRSLPSNVHPQRLRVSAVSSFLSQ